MSLRVIGGQWRSRRLLRPRNEATRPMPDRVKQTVFDVLGSRFGTPGELPPLVVADLFAGSGSMGLEALSRGASWCSFRERDREALAALRRNIEAFGASEFCEVFAGDAWSAAGGRAGGRPFDLIFLDPPYRDSDDASPGGRIGRFLVRLAEQAECRPVVVLHHSARVRYADEMSVEWRIDDARTIGSSAVTMFVRREIG